MPRLKKERKEPIMITYFEGDDLDAWQAELAEAERRSIDEGRNLIIVNRPKLTDDEREKRMNRVKEAAAVLISKYIQTKEDKIMRGLLSGNEEKAYRKWYTSAIFDI